MADQLSLLAGPPAPARPEGVPADAVLREDGTWCWAKLSGEEPRPLYRYLLGRWWAPGPRCLFAMLNPSKAALTVEDNTSRKVRAFATSWGHGSLEIANQYAWRETESGELVAAYKRGVDVVGPENDAHVFDAALRANRIVVAWGAKSPDATRARNVLRILGGPVHCLRVTKDGHPEHPLYIPGATLPSLYAGAAR